MNQIQAGIISGAGYTGGELLRLLLHHPAINLRFVTSESQQGQPIYQVHKDLLPYTDQSFVDLNQDWDNVDVLFLCGGHGRSRQLLSATPLPSHIKLIDLSQDFRIHEDEGWVYGLPELYANRIREAKRLANPGCFATAIQLGLLPLIHAGEVQTAPHVTAITGSTGAGQSPKDTTHFSWRSHNISVYKPFSHQHLIEMKHHLGGLHESFDGALHFIPMRGGFPRGILASIHLPSTLSETDLQDLFVDYYEHQPFTKVVPFEPDLKQVVNTNYCFIQVRKHGEHAHIITCLDNLLKGASGQAVQNMNLMFDMEPQTGLRLKPAIY